MSMVHNGQIESIICFSFSRFARSTSHLLKALQKCKEKQTGFISITEAIDTQSPMGLALFTILGALSQLERELIRERVKAGLAAARAKGKLLGRVKKRDSELIRKLLKSGVSFRKAAIICRCSSGSINAEKIAMKKEEEAQKKKQELEHKIDNPPPIKVEVEKPKQKNEDDDKSPTPPTSPTRPSLKLV
jgi:DNA invertase Pin-like site-specific DNA recombinase